MCPSIWMRVVRMVFGEASILSDKDLRRDAAFSWSLERPEQAAERQAAAIMEGFSFRNLYSVAAMVARVSACLLTE